MKKVLSLILILFTLCSMVACSSDSSIEYTKNTTETTIAPTAEASADNTILATEPSTNPSTETTTVPVTEPATEATTLPVTEPATEATTLPATEPATESDSNDIRPDFKAAMDSYEAFFDEYVAIMKKYKESPMDLSILTDYANYMGQYADMMQKFENWESEDLNTAELAYYIDVQARITKKLLEIA